MDSCSSKEDAILKVLQSINETLAAGSPQKRTSWRMALDNEPRFRWHEHTQSGGHKMESLASQENLSKVEIPDDEDLKSGKDSEKASISGSGTHVLPASRYLVQGKSSQWKHQYRSPFVGLEQQLLFIHDPLLKTAGDFCTIPHDGRVELTLTPSGMGLFLRQNSEKTRRVVVRSKELQLKARSLLNDFEKFSSQLEALRKSENRRDSSHTFFVTDLDPWRRFVPQMSSGEATFLKYRFGHTLEVKGFDPGKFEEGIHYNVAKYANFPLFRS